MATYDTLEFNVDRFRQIILEEGNVAMRYAIAHNFGSLKYFSDIIQTNGVVEIDYDVIFDDVRAWVMFFGQGQGINQDNPWLEEYKKTDFWAEGRHDDGTVVKRGYDNSYDQYDYRTGKLRHYEHGADEAGEELEKWQQAGLTKVREVDFWKTIEQTYNSFVTAFTNVSIPRIEMKMNECFEIKHHSI